MSDSPATVVGELPPLKLSQEQQEAMALGIGYTVIALLHTVEWHGFDSPRGALDYWHLDLEDTTAYAAVVRDLIAWTAGVTGEPPGFTGTARARLLSLAAAYDCVALDSHS